METNKEPSLVDQAKSLAKAAYEWSVEDRFQKVPPEIFQQRKDICLSCPNWDKEAFGGAGRCKLCGCSVMKLYMPSAKCPDNPPRWQSISF